MTTRVLSVLFSLFFLILGLSHSPAVQAEPAMKRGANLAHWLQHKGTQPIDKTDLKALHTAGFDHVRLPFDPMVLGWNPERPEELPLADKLRDAVDMILASGLNIIFDMHPENKFKLSLEKDPENVDALVRLWRKLAREYAGVPPNRLAFELLNEPTFWSGGPKPWNVLVQQLHAAVRENAPKHLILASTRKSGGVAYLKDLQPLKDPNVMYVIHLYQPHVFTHQGPKWSQYSAISGVPFPASKAGDAAKYIDPLAPSDKLARAEKGFREYIDTDYGQAEMQEYLEIATEWAKKHNVRLICNEFGVIAAHADRDSRYRWINDARVLFEKNNIGWTIWDYAADFGITRTPNSRIGPRELDPAALKALGLTKGS